MRSNFTIWIILLFVANFNARSQDNFQTFTPGGFKVKCNCKLKENTIFIDMAKKRGEKGIIGAFVCAENEDNPDIGVIVNINVYDVSSNYESIPVTDHRKFETKYLSAYEQNLSNSGTTYSYITYKGASALEYSFDQMGLPTKAIMFLKNKKSYLLQVATRKELERKFIDLKNSFDIL